MIISLGLLVDDAIIAIEMMIVKLEQGYSRFDAACHAYKVTAFPMLTGTLITCAGFIPIGFSKGSASGIFRQYIFRDYDLSNYFLVCFSAGNAIIGALS